MHGACKGNYCAAAIYKINGMIAGANAIKLHDDFLISVQSAECVHDIYTED